MCSNQDIEDFLNISNEDKINKHNKKDIMFVNEIIDKSKDITNKDEMNKIVRDCMKRFRTNLSKNKIREIYNTNFINKDINPIAINWMIKRIMRKQSGVLVVTIVLAPEWDTTRYRRGAKFSCSKNCYYCPVETDLEGNPTQPRSYLSGEPAMRRATRHNFSVTGQFNDRINCYLNNGSISIADFKNPDVNFKIEVIVSGGTFECYPKDYRDSVIQELYYAANNFGKYDYNEIKDIEMGSIEDEIKINETAKFRIIGMTLETRPDFVNKYSIRDYRRYGVTRIQIGVQHFDDKILKLINRGCYTEHTKKAIRLLKMCGIKVVVHLMPDLPGSNPELDKWMFDEAIDNPDVQFDDVKIYPTAICKSDDENLIVYSKIGEWYENGTYKPYSEENINDLVEVLMHYLTRMNPWVRIQRLVRDIPTSEIEAGYGKKVNLRQLINDKMKKENIKCMDIRTMEIKDKIYPDSHTRLVVYPYNASDGKEYHIQYEAHSRPWYFDLTFMMFLIYSFFMGLFGYNYYYSGNRNTYEAVYGFCRLRIDPTPGGDILPDLKDSALIREVHVYGNSVGVNTGDKKIVSQHRGFGKRMVRVAENIAKNNNYHKIAVIAGVGTREYYKNKCGYHLPDDSTYMFKFI